MVRNLSILRLDPSMVVEFEKDMSPVTRIGEKGGFNNEQFSTSDLLFTEEEMSLFTNISEKGSDTVLNLNTFSDLLSIEEEMFPIIGFGDDGV